MTTLDNGTRPPASEAHPAGAAEAEIVAALRRGDEQAFMTLVEQHHASLVRLALMYVPSSAVAEDVAQETWLAVLQGLQRFEGRASLKTWIFQILINRAKTRGQREGRTIPFSALMAEELDSSEPAVEPERFLGADHPRWPRHWASAPRSWDGVPEEHFLSRETYAAIRAAIDALPPVQRSVITLRDVEGWSASEVCNIFAISESNQRVLLHRARSKVRRSIERYLDSGVSDTTR